MSALTIPMGKTKQGDVNAPVKRRPGPTTPELRKALELVFLGQDGVLLSVRGAANKVISVNRTFLQTTVDVIADELPSEAVCWLRKT